MKEFIILRHSDDVEFYNNIIPYQKEIADNTCIYFICRKPKFLFSPNSLRYKNDILELGFEIHQQNGVTKFKGSLRECNHFFRNVVNFSLCEKKHLIKAHFRDGFSTTIETQHMFPLFDSMPYNDFSQLSLEDFNEYEILYIGQSTGKLKKSNAFLRVSSGKHNKLYKILSDTLDNHSNCEIFTICFTINAPRLFGISDPRFTLNEGAHFFHNNKIDISILKDRQKTVNLMEAILIKYFEPKYNEKLKNQHINRKHHYVKDYVDNYDLNSIITEINTKDVENSYEIKLFSKKQQPRNLHKIPTPVHNEKNRFNINDILNNSSS